MFININTDFSNAVIVNVSEHKNCLGGTPFTCDATPLNNKTIFNDRTENNS